MQVPGVTGVVTEIWEAGAWKQLASTLPESLRNPAPALMVFGNFVLVEFKDEKGGLLCWAREQLPESLRPGLATALRMNPLQFVAMCEDPRILAAVRSNPLVQKTVKALTSGFAGKLDTSKTKEGIAFEAELGRQRREFLAELS